MNLSRLSVRRREPRLWWAIVAVIAGACVFVTALISQGIFERIPHVEDEAAYWFQAQVFAQGRLAAPTPAHPLAFWSPFVIDRDGLRFGKYPPGYPLLLALGMLAGAPWAVNAALGALTLVLLADLGRRLYTPAAGLLTAALGLSCPALLVAASNLLSHAAAICLTAFFLWAFSHLRDACRNQACRRARLWAWAAGAGLGYLFITRPYDAIAVGIPFAIYLLTRLLGPQRRAWLTPIGILALVAGLIAVSLPLYWRALSGEWFYDPYLAVFPYDRPGFGPDVGYGGYTLAEAWLNLRVNAARMATGFLGWPGLSNLVPLALPLVAVGLVALRRRVAIGRDASASAQITTWDGLLAATFVSVVAVYATYWFYGGHDGGFPRYWLPALPALLLLSGRGVDVVVTATRRWAAHTARPLAEARGRGSSLMPHLPLITVYAVLAALVAYSGFVFLPPELAPSRGRYGVTAAPLEVVRQAGVHHALVFVADAPKWNDFAVFFAANSPTLDSDIVYARFRNPIEAAALRAHYRDRACYLQIGSQLAPCPVGR
jgi:4-amino-4-deoxy-L-arabinose transferase-like glycosyltransferase